MLTPLHPVRLVSDKRQDNPLSITEVGSRCRRTSVCSSAASPAASWSRLPSRLSCWLPNRPSLSYASPDVPTWAIRPAEASPAPTRNRPGRRGLEKPGLDPSSRRSRGTRSRSQQRQPAAFDSCKRSGTVSLLLFGLSTLGRAAPARSRRLRAGTFHGSSAVADEPPSPSLARICCPPPHRPCVAGTGSIDD